MKEPYVEGVATHDGPESCAGTREGAGEALTGARAGWVIEPRNAGNPGCRRRYPRRKATRPRAFRTRDVDRPRAVEDPMHVAESFCARTGRSLDSPAARWRGRPRREGHEAASRRCTDAGKSDRPVVPTKSSNKAAQAAAEAMEGRGPAKGNTNQQNARRTQSRDTRAQCAGTCAQAARRNKGAKFTALLHHVTRNVSAVAFFQLKKKAAAGVDGVTWERMRRDLDDRISEPSWRGCIEERTGQNPLETRATSRKRTGPNVHLASPRWRTRSSSAPSSR